MEKYILDIKILSYYWNEEISEDEIYKIEEMLEHSIESINSGHSWPRSVDF